ncbi:MAG: hypothetical protein COA78_17465 [Blastopirellula sp.]|nr:MAG: hypothetical protein COA78_17465 [Blastopirellula sp.]
MSETIDQEKNEPESGGFAETFAAEKQEPAAGNKEELDIALAAVLLGSGQISERQLTTALTSWTIHGDVTLSKHILNRQLLSSDALVKLEEQAGKLLERVKRVPLSGGTSKSQSISLLERIDSSGRVAKLLGIRGVMNGNADQQSRFSDSRYKLVRKLGQGGLGTVWLAHDENMQRYVALKEVTNANQASDATLERFRREAEITGRLEHPGIVPVYQLGHDKESGSSFYSMRFLGKQTLQDAISEYHERRDDGDDDPMLLRNLLTAFVSMCQALGHAHSRSVIHRDLKPENVAIDSFGQVIVIDWGLAKVLDEYGLGDTQGDTSIGDIKSGGSTMAGQVLGTPLYMAPEQATGRIDEIDHRTDIYGLGATLFAILTGLAPHELSQSKSTDNGARGLISAIASGKTPLPREANSQVDPALEAICLKSMAKKRYARYQSASELAEDVQRWMAGEPVSAFQERPLQKMKRWMTHNQRLSQLIGGLLIVVLVTGVTLGIVSQQTKQAAEIVSQQTQQAAQHAQFEQMRSEGREIEVRITSSVEDLRDNVRFMSSLPPIQALIHAPEQSEQAVDPKLDQDSKEVWRGRLEKIYTGLLRANSDYLSISYVEIIQDESGEENADLSSQVIVKVERSLGNRAEVKALPPARLAEFNNEQLVQEALSLSPDVIKISLYTGDIKDEANPNQYATFQAATPVFDEVTGKLYGMVVIEHDFPKVVVEILDSLALHTSVIRAINPKGEVRLIAAPGHEVVKDLKRTPVEQIVPECGAFYSLDNFEQYMSDGTSYVAQKIYLDPNDPATGIGLVLTLEE